MWGNWANTIIRESRLKGRLNSSKWKTYYRTPNYECDQWMSGSRNSEAEGWIFILVCLGTCHQHNLYFLLVKVLCSSIFFIVWFWPSPWKVKHTGAQSLWNQNGWSTYRQREEDLCLIPHFNRHLFYILINNCIYLFIYLFIGWSNLFCHGFSLNCSNYMKNM